MHAKKDKRTGNGDKSAPCIKDWCLYGKMQPPHAHKQPVVSPRCFGFALVYCSGRIPEKNVNKMRGTWGTGSCCKALKGLFCECTTNSKQLAVLSITCSPLRWYEPIEEWEKETGALSLPLIPLRRELTVPIWLPYELISAWATGDIWEME